MSAFVVSKQHIDALVTAAVHNSPYGKFRYYHDGDSHEVTSYNATEVGQMLWDENIASVEHRYPDVVGTGDRPGSLRTETVVEGVEPITFSESVEPYRWQSSTVLGQHTIVNGGTTSKAVDILKLIDCYEYQSCEHPEWEASAAFAFCQALRSNVIGRLPGYDSAAWSL